MQLAFASGADSTTTLIIRAITQTSTTPIALRVFRAFVGPRIVAVRTLAMVATALLTLLLRGAKSYPLSRPSPNPNPNPKPVELIDAKPVM
ncbi:hypothetical protein WAI453_008882 [Rhynchosporium graminicola]